jgi:uncharacterized protein HemX
LSETIWLCPRQNQKEEGKSAHASMIEVHGPTVLLKAFMTGKHTNTSDSTTATSGTLPSTADTPATGVNDDAVNVSDAASETEASGVKSVLSEHKGKLAIGVAATLGAMIYYGWRQKQLPKEDPEAYARLQRIRDSMKANGSGKQSAKEKQRAGKKDE